MKKKLTAVLLVSCLLLWGCAGGAPDADPGAAAEAAQASPEQTDTERSNMEQTALTVNGEAVSLRVWNFYLRMNQMLWEKQYLETYGDDMWSREAGEDGTTLADRLKEEVLDHICGICLACQHAEEYGVLLDEEKTEEIRRRSEEFMETYHEALLEYAGADEEFVFAMLSRQELSAAVAEATVADYEPEIAEEDAHREGICYVLLSTTGLKDAEGNLEPFSQEEVERRTLLAKELSERARESGSLKEEAEAEGLTPIEATMGKTNEGDGHEPRMLDAARLLAVGEVSDPVWTEEGWFVVQHTSDYDAEGTEYWRAHLTEQAWEEECGRIMEMWEETAEITVYEEVLDQADVKIVLKELL